MAAGLELVGPTLAVGITEPKYGIQRQVRQSLTRGLWERDRPAHRGFRGEGLENQVVELEQGRWTSRNALS